MACWTTTWTGAEHGGLWSDNDVCVGLENSSEGGSDSGLAMKTPGEEKSNLVMESEETRDVLPMQRHPYSNSKGSLQISQ